MLTSRLSHQNLEAVVAAWNAALPHDPVSCDALRRIVFQDMNYDPEATWVAQAGSGAVVGLALSVVRTTVAGSDGGGRDYEFGSGFLKGFFVAEGPDDDAIAAELLSSAEAYCAGAGKDTLRVTEYGGPYVYPGIDVRYERLRGILSARGYRDVRTIEDVSVDLDEAEISIHLARLRERVGPSVELFTWDPSLLPAMRKFVEEGAQPQWFPTGWENGLAEPHSNVLALRCNGEILGWAHYWPSTPRAGFGPILVLPRARGNGYGGLLLLECMGRAHREGSKTMSAGWANTGFYVANGWHITRRYAVLHKQLSGEQS